MDGNLAASDRQTYMTEEQMGELADKLANDEINTLMATEVKGAKLTNLWVREPDILNLYKFPDGTTIAVDGWTPTTDMSQAMECAAKHCEDNKKYWFDIAFSYHEDEGAVIYSCTYYVYSTVVFTVTSQRSPALAICKAILKAKGLDSA